MPKTDRDGKRAAILFSASLVFFVAFAVSGQGLPGASAARNAVSAAVRSSDGKPNFNGIWQVLNTAEWDLRAHSAGPSPLVAMGAVGAEPPGLGVVEGDEIPYQPWAAAKQKQNAASWLTLDPEVKCYLPGVPRATYMPFPFQIIQTPQRVLIAYEYASTSRSIPITDKKPDSPVDTWMGDSYAHWEGDTLVVKTAGFNDQTWFDRAGDFHSEALQVEERYKLISRDVMMYEVTIDDPKVFTRPWKISMPVYRHVEKNAQLLEFKCVEFVEELMYGHLKKKSDTKPGP